jgi:hexosaminidase
MVDTARHFASVEEIKSILDVMSWSKLNVFHWHVTDDESFSFHSQTAPKLSQGMFSERDSYSVEDVRSIVEFAYERGIHVVPEFAAPAHTQSWGRGYPDIVVK